MRAVFERCAGPEPAPKRRLIMAEPGARRQPVELLGIAAAQHDVIHQERLHQQRHERVHDAPPGLLAQPLQAALAEEMLQARAA